MALSLKQKLFDYLAHRHFALMSPEVRARFDDYAKNKDFQGHMKFWNDNYKDKDIPDLLSGSVGGVVNNYQLTPDEWEELYDAFQEAFQTMDSSKTPSFGNESPYKKPTLSFIAEYFGDSSKTFTTTQATGIATGIITNLYNFLDDKAITPPATQSPYAALKPFLTNTLKDVFSDGFTYDLFIDGLKTHKYDSDLKFREKLGRVIYYIQYHGPKKDGSVPPSSEWPQNIGYEINGAGMAAIADNINPTLDAIYSADIGSWYAMPKTKKDEHINKFKNDFWKISDILLTKSSVRSDFLASAPNTIGQPLSKAIGETDYENKDSKDYVSEKYPDEKNWLQQLEEWKNDTYEDYLRKFTNPSRGTRVYFSPWTQNIMKAFDKNKIKPTDGLEGILAKKNDILGKLQSTKTSTDHFNWFADTIEKLKSAGMGDAVKGALGNSSQLRRVVSGIIAEAVKQNKIDEATTALEILSVAKYGLLSSRTLDALREATKDATWLSDKNLSFNGNEGIRAVTSVIDATARTAVIGIGMGITALRNAFHHSRTKIGNNIKNNSILKNAHDKWDTENQLSLKKLRDANNRMHIDMKLDALALGNGLSGYVIANETDLANAETTLAGMAPGAAGYDDLQADIDLYKDSKKRQDEVTNWDENHPDPYKKLIAYWDMLETTTKTHTFTLGSMSVKRKAMLADWANGNSPAQNIAKQYLQNYGDIRA